MLIITRRAVDAARDASPSERMTLPFELRSKSRFRARLTSGEEVGVKLERGHVLRDGDRLRCDDGRVVAVFAADETVTTVFNAGIEALARIAYHLGNRHVALQIGDGWLRYSHDHVLDDMVLGLGALITVGQAPFEPENGAYHGGEHSHDHDHDHAHDPGRDVGGSHDVGITPA